jgi:pimeloyl-ACP methyl ester carboxylesterase
MKKLLKVFLIIALIPFLLIVVFLAYSIINEKVNSKNDFLNNPVPGKLVNINESQLHIHASGEKNDTVPTIVFEAGGGMCSEDWQLIQPEISKNYRTCSWDRPGYGWSENTGYDRTSKKAAKELHELLHRNGESPPFLLVGHSYGGHTLRIFADLFADEVDGIVLLDPRPENMLDIPILKEIGSGQSGKLSTFSFLSKIGITRLIGKNMLPSNFQQKLPDYPYQICFKPKYFEANLSEAKNIAISDNQVKECNNINQIPLIVIRHGIPDIFSFLSTQDSIQAEKNWIKTQETISKTSFKSELWVAMESGHNILIDEPEIVIKAIKHLLE